MNSISYKGVLGGQDASDQVEVFLILVLAHHKPKSPVDYMERLVSRAKSSFAQNSSKYGVFVLKAPEFVHLALLS